MTEAQRRRRKPQTSEHRKKLALAMERFYASAEGERLRKQLSDLNRGRPKPRGKASPFWKGDDVGYHGGHKRVYAERGSPESCENCGTSEGNLDWANLSGNYPDPYDYAALCRSCHRKHDATVRRAREEAA